MTAPHGTAVVAVDSETTNTSTGAVNTPNYVIPAAETPAQRVRVSAKLTARLRLAPANIADALCQGYYTSTSWEEYDRLLAYHDRSVARGGGGLPFDLEGPEALDDDRDRDPGPPIEARSDRTLRRYRGERKGEIAALIARDGRTTTTSARARVTVRKTADWRLWVKVCDECAQPFEAVRSDARYCSDGCRKRVARRSR